MDGAPPPNSMKHAGREIVLNAPSSQTLELKGSGVAGAAGWLEFNWEPVDKGATELEIRARIVSTSAALGIEPIVRWFTEIGHGDQTWRDPPPVLPIIVGSPYLEYGLPGRGMSWRVTARQFRVGFRTQGTLGGAAVADVSVQVSALPGWGAFWPVYPYQQLAVPFSAVQQPFPITAREWRLQTLTGVPLAPGAIAIRLIGINGGLLAVVDGAEFAEYRPIPHLAAGWVAAAACEAAYR